MLEELEKHGGAALKVRSVEEMLIPRQEWLRDILSQHGLDPDWQAHIRRTPDEIGEAPFYGKEALSDLEQAARFRREGALEMAVKSAIDMERNIWLTVISLYEPYTVNGYNQHLNAKKGGDMKPRTISTILRMKMQRAANLIWRANPDLKLLSVAKRIAAEFGESHESIRKIIKKPN